MLTAKPLAQMTLAAFVMKDVHAMKTESAPGVDDRTPIKNALSLCSAALRRKSS